MTADLDMSTLSDAQLIALHLEGKTNEYLGFLYSRYTPLIYGVCLKYLRNADDASDAVMDIFEELLEKVERHEIKEFRTWIYSVTKNHCLQVIRKKGREFPADYNERIMESEGITHLFNEGKDENRFAALERCMEKLPEKQRECIEKFFFQNKSYADISLETRYHLKNVKSYIQNGKRNLKICIEKNSHETD